MTAIAIEMRHLRQIIKNYRLYQEAIDERYSQILVMLSDSIMNRSGICGLFDRHQMRKLGPSKFLRTKGRYPFQRIAYLKQRLGLSANDINVIKMKMVADWQSSEIEHIRTLVWHYGQRGHIMLEQKLFVSIAPWLYGSLVIHDMVSHDCSFISNKEVKDGICQI